MKYWHLKLPTVILKILNQFLDCIFVCMKTKGRQEGERWEKRKMKEKKREGEEDRGEERIE